MPESEQPPGKSYTVEGCPLAVFASYLIRVRTKPSVNPKFLYYFFNSEAYWKQVNSNKGANLKQGMSGTVLANLLFPYPQDKAEQQEIAHILQAVDAKIAAAERKRAGLEELFRAMLGELMTGRVRVPPVMLSREAAKHLSPSASRPFAVLLST